VAALARVANSVAAGGILDRERGQRARPCSVPLPSGGYCASKAGVLGLTRDLAQQWSRRRGIRVNALCPGYYDSEITNAEGAEALRAMVADNSVLGRFGQQEELDSALLFLASPASSYMTGSSLVIDGGLSSVV